MTNTAALADKIKKSGLKRGYIADKLGLSYHWLDQKIKNKVAFKAFEIQILCEILDITDLEEKDAIFFARDVEEISTEEQE